MNQQMQSFRNTENERHKVILQNQIVNTLYLIYQQFKSNSVYQSQYYIQLIHEANGLKVFIKYFSDKQIYQIEDEEIDRLNQQTILLACKLIYIQTKNNQHIVQNLLVPFNFHIIIKKLIQKYQDASIQKVCYKLLNIQINTWNRKLFERHKVFQNLITMNFMYNLNKPVKEESESDLFDNYKKEQKKVNELDFEQQKSLIQMFNKHNYLDYY